MTQLENILVPTDLSEPSRRALVYGCWLASENKASLMVMHVANEFQSWQLCSEDLMFIPIGGKWPADRVLSEAGLDLSRFLEPSLAGMQNCPSVSKRVVLGAVAQQIAAVAEEENADLVIMAPSRVQEFIFLALPRAAKAGVASARVSCAQPISTSAQTPTWSEGQSSGSSLADWLKHNPDALTLTDSETQM